MSPPPSMFGAPREISPAASLGDYIQPNLRYGLKIWWAFYWPTALAAIVLAIGFNSAMRLFLQVGVMPERLIAPAVWIARFDFLVFYYAGTIFAIAYILRKSSGRSASDCFRIGSRARRHAFSRRCDGAPVFGGPLCGARWYTESLPSLSHGSLSHGCREHSLQCCRAGWLPSLV